MVIIYRGMVYAKTFYGEMVLFARGMASPLNSSTAVRIFFNRKYDKMLSYHEESKNCGTVAARLPFLGDMSMQLKKSFPAW